MVTKMHNYSKEVIEHFYNPRNVGDLDKKDINVGCGLAGSPQCGDLMKLCIKVKDNIIIDAKFKSFGCAANIAASSYTTEFLIGKTIQEALKISDKDISDYLDLPSIKFHCSVLTKDAVKSAIDDYNNKENLRLEKTKQVNYDFNPTTHPFNDRLRRYICSKSHPMPQNCPKGIHWEHEDAEEVLDLGDSRGMECKTCGLYWNEELPQ
jgi:nitrogen fixation NifU-like protein